MPIILPTVTGYRLKEVQIPAPKSEQQIINEVMGVTAPTPPPGPPRTVIKVIIDVDDFPINEMPFQIFVGDQSLKALAVSGTGKEISGIAEETPHQGDRIVLHFPVLTSDEPASLLAGTFDINRLEETGIG